MSRRMRIYNLVGHPVRVGNLRLRLIGGFLLLLRLFGPRRHNSVRARVGDGLPQMLAKVPGDHDERAAQGGLTAEHFLRLVRVRVVERNDGATEMCEGILEGLNEFRLVAGKSHDGFEIEAGRRRRPEGPGGPVVGAHDVRVDFSNGANPLTGTPGVLLSRHGFGQAGISLFVKGNCFEELCTWPRGRAGGSWGGGLIGRLVLGPSRSTETQGDQRKSKKIKRDTAHSVLL